MCHITAFGQPLRHTSLQIPVIPLFRFHIVGYFFQIPPRRLSNMAFPPISAKRPEYTVLASALILAELRKCFSAIFRSFIAYHCQPSSTPPH
jgi:hypothetical protein|nr:MAG: hypothetical protein [Bacteriophage sp.]